MSIFPEFGGLINQNIQQPPKAESEKSENDTSKSKIIAYMERDESKKQLQLWRDAEKKEPWHDAPPKVKVKVSIRDRIWVDSRVVIDFTLGLPPEVAFDVVTNPDNKPSSRIINGRELLKNISRKVTSKDKSYGLAVKSKKALSWNFLWLSITIPLDLSITEKRNELYVHFGRNFQINSMKYMHTFFGVFDMEPIYIDSKRLCKHIEPKSREEYEKCSGGQGRIATKVKMKMWFTPSSFYNLPPFSWYIRWFIVKTTTALMEDLQTQAAKIRRA